jgi:NAD(P)-dependent dehydrogenase (short-subunit alcohol dehydrogenase family)
MDFAGRVAVISGGASGIGAACAERLRAEGAVVVTWDLANGPDIDCDVTSPESVSEALQQTIADAGTPTLHVAAAGIGGLAAPFHELPPEVFEKVISVNLRGVFHTMSAVARGIVGAGLDGSLVAISSVNGVIADPSLTAYSAAKAGVYHMVRVAAIDLGRYGIRVNAIGPGPTDTPMLSKSMATDGYLEAVEAATPLGRLGTPPMIADGVANVMRSDWITGQAVMVDGGSSLMTARGGWRAKNDLKSDSADATTHR